MVKVTYENPVTIWKVELNENGNIKETLSNYCGSVHIHENEIALVEKSDKDWSGIPGNVGTYLTLDIHGNPTTVKPYEVEHILKMYSEDN